MPAFQPYWGKPAVRNDRGDRGNVGIIRSPIRASILPDQTGHHSIADDGDAVGIAHGAKLAAPLGLTVPLTPRPIILTAAHNPTTLSTISCSH